MRKLKNKLLEMLLIDGEDIDLQLGDAFFSVNKEEFEKFYDFFDLFCS